MALAKHETIQKLARSVGLKVSPRRGQNFLIDYDVLEDIVSAAHLRREDRIVEIGPGFGILTERLAQGSSHVLAIELDTTLYTYLSDRFGQNENITIVNRDVMSISNEEIATMCGPDEAYRVIANIPYQITGKIVKKFVSDTYPKPKDMLILVQKEVAERICSLPGKMSLLALSVQLFADPRIVRDVPRHCFWPEPNVDSSLLYIRAIQEKPRYPIRDLGAFWRLLRVGFSSPRKTLYNNLASGFQKDAETVMHILSKAGIHEKARAQELSIDQWVALFDRL